MVKISTEGMDVAPLSKEQMDSLIQAEKSINMDTKTGVVYLLAVTRKA
ncbi:MAG: hypothetical protein M1609_12635 [Firmicutes bacterium]|nr:hypothetical protein [Bacillota bacterium]